MEIRSVLGAGILLLGSALAQQPATTKNPPAPAPKTQQTPATQLPEAPAAKGQESPAPFATQKEKTSYALGMSIGGNFKRQGVEVDLNTLLQGLKDAMGEGKTLITEDDARAALIQLQKDLRAKEEEILKKMAEKNKKDGEEFLAANKSKEGVVALPSGLQYKILTAGTGPKPTMNDTVSCNYRGTLINGTEFDSSYKRGTPSNFPVIGVIKGWTEALQLMPVGSKWQLFVPSDLAYGDRGHMPNIEPNATLIFEVELISIEAKPKPAEPASSTPAPKTTPAPKATPKAAPEKK